MYTCALFEEVLDVTDENSVEEELRIVDYPEDTGVELGQGWDTSTFQKKIQLALFSCLLNRCQDRRNLWISNRFQIVPP